MGWDTLNMRDEVRWRFAALLPIFHHLFYVFQMTDQGRSKMGVFKILVFFLTENIPRVYKMFCVSSADNIQQILYCFV